MAKRVTENICRLCRINKADKKNSHIIPKFIAKSILGGGNKKRAFIIKSDKIHKQPDYLQDSPKEDNILCSRCEEYFSVLETYISIRLYNRLWSNESSSQFETAVSEGGIKSKTCNDISGTIFRLFLYSIIWRCSISSHPVFQDFTLPDEKQESLRKNLLLFSKTRESELLDIIATSNFQLAFIPFVLLTTDNFLDKTANFLFALPSIKEPFQLTLNEFYLVFSFDNNSVQDGFGFLNNTDNEQIKIGVLTSSLWERLRHDHLELMTKKSVESLHKINETPYWIKNKRP